MAPFSCCWRVLSVVNSVPPGLLCKDTTPTRHGLRIPCHVHDFHRGDKEQECLNRGHAIARLYIPWQTFLAHVCTFGGFPLWFLFVYACQAFASLCDTYRGRHTCIGYWRELRCAMVCLCVHPASQ